MKFIIKYNAKIFWATLFWYWVVINFKLKNWYLMVVHEHEIAFGIIDA